MSQKQSTQDKRDRSDNRITDEAARRLRLARENSFFRAGFDFGKNHGPGVSRDDALDLFRASIGEEM